LIPIFDDMAKEEPDVVIYKFASLFTAFLFE